VVLFTTNARFRRRPIPDLLLECRRTVNRSLTIVKNLKVMRKKISLAIIAAILIHLMQVANVAGADDRPSERGTMHCGPSSLCVAARILGRPIEEKDCQEYFEVDRKTETCSLYDVQRAAHKLGFVTAVTDLNTTTLKELPSSPVIVCLRSTHSGEPGHFVVLYGRLDESVQLIDYPEKIVRADPRKLLQICSSRGLAIAASRQELEEQGFLEPAWISLSIWWTALAVGVATIAGQVWLSLSGARRRAMSQSVQNG
jgi:hypothetical protein